MQPRVSTRRVCSVTAGSKLILAKPMIDVLTTSRAYCDASAADVASVQYRSDSVALGEADCGRTTDGPKVRPKFGFGKRTREDYWQRYWRRPVAVLPAEIRRFSADIFAKKYTACTMELDVDSRTAIRWKPLKNETRAVLIR